MNYTDGAVDRWREKKEEKEGTQENWKGAEAMSLATLPVIRRFPEADFGVGKFRAKY